jgi:hypothetical protein
MKKDRKNLVSPKLKQVLEAAVNLNCTVRTQYQRSDGGLRDRPVAP